jgi:hypothetical protein
MLSFNTSTPQKRERLLLIAGGIAFVIVAAVMFNYLFGSDVLRLRTQRSKQKEDVEKFEAIAEQKETVKRNLAELTAGSLPPEDSLAQSLYQNWLIETAYRAGLRNNRVDAGAISPMKDLYKKYTFTLHGRGTLGQISEFLRYFDQTDYLHLIRKVSPRTIKDSNELDISITVEALALPQAQRTRSLRKISDDKLRITDQEKAVLDAVTKRNLFAAWSPPQPQGQPPQRTEERRSNDFDHAPYCYVIASVVGQDGKPQVWVNVRTEGKLYKLFEGEMFRLGGVRCYVKKIEEKRVTFEAAGGMYTVKVGSSFTEYE